MSEKMRVDKIIIDVGNGLAMNLTLDQAEELLKILSDLFGKKEQKIVYIQQPYPVYPWRYWGITWNDASPLQLGHPDVVNPGVTGGTYSISLKS